VHRARGRRIGAIGLGVTLAATSLILLGSLAQKQRCSTGDWADGRQYRQLCYSDIVPLYGTEHLQGSRLPFLNACPTEAGGQCDEYPVLTMYFMRTAAWISNPLGGPCEPATGGCYQAFFYSNALLLFLCALITAALLHRLAGANALFFSLAPSLFIYAFVNWDLLAVALATAATYAFLRHRDAWAGVLVGLGAAAKLYPALLLVPFVLHRWRERRTGEASVEVTWSLVAFAAVNLPFVLLAPGPWATFFRFNTQRVVDWDSLWFVACQRIQGGQGCGWSPHLVDTLSLLLFGAVAAGLYVLRSRRDPGFARWTFAFPLLVAFLLTNKVYSPQYGLWLLPWFALALPNLAVFATFEAADVAVFVTRFTWFGRLSGLGGAPLGAFEVAVVVRALVLVWALVSWVRQDEDVGELTDPEDIPTLRTA
jgi:uncharacterized membrane protein